MPPLECPTSPVTFLPWDRRYSTAALMSSFCAAKDLIVSQCSHIMETSQWHCRLRLTLNALRWRNVR